MSAPDLARAAAEVRRARQRLSSTLAELQARLKPGTLATNAWEGVKERSGEMADDAVQAVKARPVIVSAGLAAFALFLARAPLKSAVSRLFSADEESEDGAVTTRLDGGDDNYDLTAPVAERSASEGASV